MKCLIQYDEAVVPPRLTLYIHDAPHRRSHVKVLMAYRKSLLEACGRAGIRTPIKVIIDLDVYFINPTSPDHDNLATALHRAIDGKALGGGPSLLLDDGQISKYTSYKLQFN